MRARIAKYTLRGKTKVHAQLDCGDRGGLLTFHSRKGTARTGMNTVPAVAPSARSLLRIQTRGALSFSESRTQYFNHVEGTRGRARGAPFTCFQKPLFPLDCARGTNRIA